MERFNIFEYIGKDVPKTKELKRLYNLNLSMDDNNEPYVSVNYNCGKEGEDWFIGLRAGIAMVRDAENVMKSLYSSGSLLIIPEKPIITVLYNLANKQYVLVNGTSKYQTMKEYGIEDMFIVGFINNPKAQNAFELKVNCLYEAMVNSIDENGFISVNGIELAHPIYKINAFNCVERLDKYEYDDISIANMKKIKATLGEPMGKQKTKK